MSRGVNMAIILGKLGKDPELRTANSGMAVCNFSVATNEMRKGEPHVEWHRVTAFDKTAEICAAHLQKGSSVHIVGKIQTRSYNDKQGEKRYVTEIIANSVTFVGPKSEAAKPTTVEDSDEYPF